MFLLLLIFTRIANVYLIFFMEVFFRLSFHLMHRWSVLWSLSCARSPLENREMKFLRQSWDNIDKAGDRTLLQALLSNIGKCLSSRRQLPLCSQIWKTRWKKIFSFWFSFEKPDSKPCLIDWPPLGAGDLLAAMWTTMTGGWRCLGHSYTLGGINCSILPSGIGGNGEFERK